MQNYDACKIFYSIFFVSIVLYCTVASAKLRAVSATRFYLETVHCWIVNFKEGLDIISGTTKVVFFFNYLCR